MPDRFYLEAEDMRKFYDVRRLQEILSDDGTKVPDGSVDAHPTLAEGISVATGDINAAVYQGKRYTAENLQDMLQDAIDFPADPNKVSAGRTLNQLCADLTFGWLMGRRGFGPDVMERLAPRLKSAQLLLERLYLGERVFNITDAIEAGVPKVKRIGSAGYLPSADIRILGVWPDTPWVYGTDPRNRFW